MILNNRRSECGFTLVEVMIAAVLLLAIVGLALPIVDAAKASFHAQGEAADMHQRLRAALELLAFDVRSGMAIRPYRVGDVRDDASAGVFYRGDTIAVMGVPDSSTSQDADAMRTYYLKSDPQTDTSALMRYDGHLSDLPAIEHVVRLAFEYYGDSSAGGDLEKLEPALLTDGPWMEDASHRLYDADLLRIRQVRVRVRVESSDASLRGQPGALFVHGGTSNASQRFLPDEEIELHVAARNLRRDP